MGHRVRPPTDADRLRWRERNARNRELLKRERASHLTPPPGWTAAQTRDAAVRIAGHVIGEGGGKEDLRLVLRACGLLHDPEQISGIQLAHPQSHPYGDRN